jgi:O-methyltransferase involved in polyketide biosynthesis
MRGGARPEAGRKSKGARAGHRRAAVAAADDSLWPEAVLEAWRTAYAGEPVRFGIDEGTLAPFLAARGYRVVEHLPPAEMERRFLTRPDGTLAGRVVALFDLVHAAITP